MNRRDYDPIKKECKKCGCLVAPDKRSLEAHTVKDCLLMYHYYQERLKEVSNAKLPTLQR